MIEFERIKLIIWDLDETFWKGTLSEEEVEIPEDNLYLIKRLTDIGIINSINSKNDWDNVRKELIDKDVFEYFVFPSVSWDPKGNRVKQQIEDMQLRATNVLFLDDNPSNREEVVFFNPGIMIGTPEDIPYLLELAENSSKEDGNHNRLRQYRILEKKKKEKDTCSSNEEFLRQSNIKVTICYDCMDHIERIYDLLMRSNQLNYTKVRSSICDLEILLKDNLVESAYVKVSDRFGDYGIVGFYAKKNDKLLHFTFSCRTLGMGIEQYVYHEIGCPKVEIVGEVIGNLSRSRPSWINQNENNKEKEKMQIKGLTEHTVLVKGPCDLFQIYPYIGQTELFDTEFTYVVNDGLTIESTGHTTNVVEAGRLSDEEKRKVLDEVPFTHDGIYNNSLYKNHYKVVFLSILTDANLGVYRRKGTGEQFAFLEYIHPITDVENWDSLIKGEYNCAGFKFDKKILEDFAEKYEFIGRNTPEQIVKNLRYIRSNLPEDCLLVIMLGGELYYEKNIFPAYEDRHIVHKQINDAIRMYAKESEGIRLMDVNQYLVDQSSFYDHFNHYIKPVYYKLAQEMVDIVNEVLGSSIKETSKFKMVQVRVKEMLAPFYYKIRDLTKFRKKTL